MDAVKILRETRSLVICVKPAGVLSQQGQPGQVSMISLLEAQLGGAVYPVHRLDREVGGVMVYAKTAAAAADLSRQIQQGQMKKEYLAVVQGGPEADSGTLEDLLFHDKGKNKSYVVKRARKGVKEARLSYRVLERRDGVALVQVRLFTGRTHQIRVQFASRGMPLLGDSRYGGGPGEMALWSVRLTLQEPGGRQSCFQQLPDYLGGFSEFPPLQELS